METHHILPVNDKVKHKESADCDCQPKVEYHENGMIIIHNAYDGREVFEEARENASKNLN